MLTTSEKILKVYLKYFKISIKNYFSERKEERDNRMRERQEEKSRIQSFKKNYEKVQNSQSISLNRSSEFFASFYFILIFKINNRGR